MTVLLLGSTVALLLLSAVASPVRNNSPSYDDNLNLNHIIDLVGEYNGSLRRALVEDVGPLTEGKDGCTDVFFCKVHNILNNYDKFDRIVGNLKIFIKHKNCPDLLEHVKRSCDSIQLADLFTHLTECIQKRNMGMDNKSKQ